MRKLENFVTKYGSEVGTRLYHVLQSQAGHASVGARLRRKMEAIRARSERPLPLFEHPGRCDRESNPISLAADPHAPPPTL
jgi:hypothetical protein